MEEKNRKRKRKHKVQTFLLTLVCLFLIAVAFAYVWNKYFSVELQFNNEYTGFVVVGLYTLLFYILAALYQTFKISIKKISEMVYSGVLSVFLSTLIIYIVIFLLQQSFPNINGIIFHLIMQFLVIVIWALISNRIYFMINKPKKTLVITDKRRTFSTLISNYGLTGRYEVKNNLDIKEFKKDTGAYIKDIETIFVSGVSSKDRNNILKLCVDKAIDVYVIPKVGDVILRSSEDLPLFHLPVLKVERFDPSIVYLFIKRFFDLLVSIIGLIITSPIMLIAALLIYFYDKGAVLYKQTRLTKNGKEFNVLKFRSMKMDAEKDGVARLSTGDNDSRITPIGKFIRATRIDELPQLINILKGDMSLVGPRPERPEIAEQYQEILPEFKLRLQAKAGLTGYAQVYGKYNTTPYDKLLMDLIYISEPSIIEDVKLIFATIKILFMKDSTEGIEEGKTTA